MGIESLEANTSGGKCLKVATESSPRETSGQPSFDLLLVLVSAAATIPVWLPAFPAMVDLPQHAAQVSLLRQLDDPTFPFQSLFEINWFTPYLLGYLLIYALEPVAGIVGASKAVVALALFALPLATARLLREVGSEGGLALLSVPVLYGFTYQWGFLNFLVAAPIGLAFLVVAIRHSKRPTIRTSVAVGLLLIALFFCHAMICIFFGFVAGVLALAESRGLRELAVRLAPLAAVVPVALLWGLRTLRVPIASAPVFWDLSWFSSAQPYYRLVSDGRGWGRTAGILPRMLGVQPGLFAVTVGMLAFAVPLLAGARPRRKWTAWLPLLACIGVLLFAPQTVFGTSFTAPRFTVFLLPLYLVGLGGPDDARQRKRLVGLAAVTSVVWIGFVSHQTRKYDYEARRFVDLLQRMQPSERALSLIFERDSSVGIAPAFLHFPAWYSAIRHGVVDPNFAWSHVQLVLYKTHLRPIANPFGFEWNPQGFDWHQFHGEDYRYFVVRAPADVSQVLFAGAPHPPRLAHRAGNWWLYDRHPNEIE